MSRPLTEAVAALVSSLGATAVKSPMASQEARYNAPLGDADRAGCECAPQDVDRMSEPSGRRDLRERAGGRLLRLLNPLARRLISAGIPTGAPNVLLTVRGRRTGKLRTVPVGLVKLDDRLFVQATYGERGWAQNLREAGVATLTEHDRAVQVKAVELQPDEAATILQRALESYRRSRVWRALVGPRFRPPIGVLTRYRIRIDEAPQDYLAEARRHPLFELRLELKGEPSRVPSAQPLRRPAAHQPHSRSDQE